MSQLHSDITTYAWLDTDSVGFPSGHLQSLNLFKENVVQPSLQALAAKTTKLQVSDEPLAEFLADEYAKLFQSTIEGYVIAVQSMWKRGLRAMLIRRENKLTKCPQAL